MLSVVIMHKMFIVCEHIVKDFFCTQFEIKMGSKIEFSNFIQWEREERQREREKTYAK